MSVGLLITSPYQVFHYRQIAAHLPDVVAVIEVRAQDRGLTEEFVRAHLPRAPVIEVAASRLASLDGRFEAIVCQTPVLPLEFLERSLVVAQQYSLAKEQYQYGIWRSHAHLNLMYGDHSVRRVAGFCHAVAVGNPLLDPYWRDPVPPRPVGSGAARPRLLYLPTYGELSSLPRVVPWLRQLDAEITVKLHHAEELTTGAAVARTLGPRVRVVPAGTDPAALLASHDGVISDFSGAAFDALHAGRPVVLAGAADPRGRDAARLSDAECEQVLLREVTAPWQPGEDLFEAFATAQRRLESEAYHRFVAAMFVNPGTAGAAAAAAIQQLLAEGEPPHFAAHQVRTTTQRYILANRRTRSRAAAGDRAGGGRLRRGYRRTRRGYRRTRRLLARSELLRRAVHATRRLRQRVWSAWRVRAPGRPGPGRWTLPPSEPSPAGRREAVWRALLPYLAAAGVPVARDSDAAGADAAVLVTARRELLRALHRLAAARADLRVRAGAGADVGEPMPLAEMRWFDLLSADWLEIGPAGERGSYRIGYAGYLTVLFVTYDRDKDRYLAARSRARRTDWTGVFGATATATAAAAGVPVAGVRRPHVSAPVDVVYTWVDSTDPAWRAAHQRHSAGGDVLIPSADNHERFLDREELRYSLRSLWLFAPFVRHVYVVTADQRPPWLATDHPRVTVVPHRDIFPDPEVLPTFNSHAIESCLHRIPGLADSFLYLNDDVFFGQEVSEEDFFTAAGLAKVRLSPSQYIYRGEPAATAIPTDWAAYRSVSLVERAFGLTFDRRVMHVPLVLRKEVLWDLEEDYPEEIVATRAARFRSPTDVAVPSMLAQFYGIATARAVEWPTARNEYIYLDTGRALTLYRYDEILRRAPKFFCLNATRYTQVDLAAQARTLHQFLSSAFPDPAPWELPAGAADAIRAAPAADTPAAGSVTAPATR